MCFAQFARKYKSHSSQKAQEEEDGDLEDGPDQCADTDALLEAVAQAQPKETDNADEDESNRD